MRTVDVELDPRTMPVADASTGAGSKPSVDLRPETPGDEPFLLALFASTRVAELGALAAAPAAKEALIRLQYQAQRRAYEAAHPSAQRSIVLIDGAPAGRLCVDRSGKEIRLIDIALSPEHRGKGTGESLLKTLLDEARGSGRTVTLHVLGTSPAARLYERLGFVRTLVTAMYDAMEWRPT